MVCGAWFRVRSGRFTFRMFFAKQPLEQIEHSASPSGVQLGHNFFI